MTLPGRTSSSTAYRYGFNGKEKDDELKGKGNSYDFGARMLDPRVGRWFARDPKERLFASFSTYNNVFNNPIIFTDPDGMAPSDWWRNKKTKQYEWKDDSGSATVYADSEYVGKSIEDVTNHFNESSNFIARLFSGPKFGDTSLWPGEITRHDPGFWERQSEGNLGQNMLYDTANGFYTTGQLFMFRSVGSGSMRNLDGSGTTTDQGVLGFANTGMSFVGYIKPLTSAVSVGSKSSTFTRLSLSEMLSTWGAGPGPIGLTEDAVSILTSNIGRVDHSARHLIEQGIITGFSPGSTGARTAFKNIAQEILTNPIRVGDYVMARGGTQVKAFLGRVNNKDVVIYIAKESVGKKVNVGDILTAVEPTAHQMSTIFK